MKLLNIISAILVGYAVMSECDARSVVAFVFSLLICVWGGVVGMTNVAHRLVNFLHKGLPFFCYGVHNDLNVPPA